MTSAACWPKDGSNLRPRPDRAPTLALVHVAGLSVRVWTSWLFRDSYWITDLDRRERPAFRGAAKRREFRMAGEYRSVAYGDTTIEFKVRVCRSVKPSKLRLA